MKYILLLFVSLSAYTSNAQCDIKTTNRPDGVTIKYFNPKPIIRNSNYEVGVAIYKNVNTNDYILSVNVLFMNMSPKKLKNDLIIQTTSSEGLRLENIISKQITMNGRILANAMYILTDTDFKELKNYSLKSIFFYLDENLEGSIVTENKNIIGNELKCLKNEI
ncbi:hypothetical protein KO494_11455 [Lacinutrix sp. C3R15]|uniref:hypothetical protein n=1 Tax=Flavobacteriaceae TaxID=49546 RepID=UPI001C0A20F4|nr:MULTISPECIES: hypothetical protein [Flavobacteriaceae]MBU2940152.1 hypothetical protein [Lacinutrix sp. C3R15]MDO6623469.1 hypothetical protein [Oceanihabitans sp. 1_MG-2023]